MNTTKFSDALGKVNDKYVMEALTYEHKSKKEHIADSNTDRKQHIPFYRVVSCAVAVILMLTCTFTVALAASPKLRAAVLSFFHIKEREQVPDGTQGDNLTEPGINQAEIGQLIKAQYIRVDSYQYGFSSGLLNNLSWSDDWKTLKSAKFWEPRDGELIPVEVDMHTSQVDITLKDIHYQGEFYWFVWKDELCCFTADNRDYDEERDIETDWKLSPIPGRTDALLLRLSTGRQMELSEHAMLYYLDTGKTEDLFADADPAVLEESDGSIWSPGTRLALITGRAGAEYPSGREWLYDRESGTLVDVSALGGIGAQMAVFADDDTLILRSYTNDTEAGRENISCWVYHISSGLAVQTLAQSPCYRQQDESPYGVIPFYGSHCMEISRDGTACLIDLTTGRRTELENFVFQKNMAFFPNSSGNKLLYCLRDSETDGLGFSQLGVVDLEKGIFIAFDREGYENLREGNIVWEDDNTVSITAVVRGSEPGTRYLILYQF